MPKGSPSQLPLALLFAALLMPPRAHAATADENVSTPEAGHAARPEPLDMRLPPAAARPPLAAAAHGSPAVQHRTNRANRAIRLEPRQSFIEWGVQGSREALIAC